MEKSDLYGKGDNGNHAGPDAEELFRLGSEALEARSFAQAHRYLQKALEMERSPNHLSQYALALMQYTGNFKAAVALCQEAIKGEPKNPNHFLRLGIVYLGQGRKKEAIRIFNLGLRVGRHHGITRILQTLGQRDNPVLPFLARTNPLNKYLGKIRNSLARKQS
jgi:tetratricopeptide (TPR) repeat protein